MIDVDFWEDVASRWFGVKRPHDDSFSMVVRVKDGVAPKSSITEGLLDENSQAYKQLHDFKL